MARGLSLSEARFKIGGNNNEVLIVTDNNLHSTSMLTPCPYLTADLVVGRLMPVPTRRQKNFRLESLLRTALLYSPTKAMLESLDARDDFNQSLTV